MAPQRGLETPRAMRRTENAKGRSPDAPLSHARARRGRWKRTAAPPSGAPGLLALRGIPFALGGVPCADGEVDPPPGPAAPLLCPVSGSRRATGRRLPNPRRKRLLGRAGNRLKGKNHNKKIINFVNVERPASLYAPPFHPTLDLPPQPTLEVRLHSLHFGRASSIDVPG